MIKAGHTLKRFHSEQAALQSFVDELNSRSPKFELRTLIGGYIRDWLDLGKNTKKLFAKHPGLEKINISAYIRGLDSPQAEAVFTPDTESSDSTLEAKCLFLNFLLNSRNEYFGGECIECERYFICKTKRQKRVYCGQKCGRKASSRETAARKREMHHQKVLKEIITTPSGALALGRQPNCSLGLATGTYTLGSSGLVYAQTDITPHYELLLHTEAQLTTTPDVFASGCAKQPPPGIGSRPGVFLGTTTTGVQVFAGLGLIYPSFAEGIYVLTGTTSFSISSFSFPTAGNLAAADLNKDGNGDLVIVENSLASGARVTVLLGNANGSFQTAVMYPIAGNYSVAAVIDDVNGDGKLDIVAVSGDQQISVLLGNGDGTFQTAQSFAAPALPGYTSNTSTPIVNLITADLRGGVAVSAFRSLSLLGGHRRRTWQVLSSKLISGRILLRSAALSPGRANT